MRLLFFILVFVGLGVYSEDVVSTSTKAPEIDCDNIPGRKDEYKISELVHCTSLKASEMVTISLRNATQEILDNFFEGKTFFKNIKLYCSGWGMIPCVVQHFRMENISAEMLNIYLWETKTKTFTLVPPPEGSIELDEVTLSENDRLESVQIGKLSNAKKTRFTITSNENLSNISVDKDSFAQLDHVFIHGNRLIPKEFLTVLNQTANSQRNWSIQLEGECSADGVGYNSTLLPKCPYIYESLEIEGNTTYGQNFDVSGLHVTKIHGGCYKIYNSLLQSVSFLVGTLTTNHENGLTCSNRIRYNDYVCDYMEVVDNYPNTNIRLIVEDNCRKCQTKDLPQANFTMLEQCEQVVVGDLSFEAKVAAMSKSIALRRIDGCYHIENTDLRTVSFLIGTRTNEKCTNTIKNNRFLCDYINVVDSYHIKNPKLEVEGNCRKCQTYNAPQEDFLMLSRCEKLVFGELSFAKVVAPMPRWINLERIDGCFKIIGTDLTTVRFLIGTRTRTDCVNEIKNNKNLCDVQRVLDSIPQGTYIDAQNNCDRICYSSMELGKKNCEEVYTDSAIPINFTRGLKRIHGAVKVTSLKTETVDQAIFDYLKEIDYDEIVFRNNEFLCDEEPVRKMVPKGKKVTFKHNCWRRCSYPQIIYHRHCHVFEGILDFRLFKDVELFERVVQKITGIEGQLKVIGTFVRHLKFRNLKYVKFTGKGPAIVIKDNKYLEKLDLNNLTSVTGKEEPRVIIQNNGKFQFRRSVAKRFANQTGMRIGKSLKIDVRKAKNTEGKCSKDDQFLKPINSSKGALYYCLVALLIFLSIITGIIIFFICKLCIEVESRRGY